MAWLNNRYHIFIVGVRPLLCTCITSSSPCVWLRPSRSVMCRCSSFPFSFMHTAGRWFLRNKNLSGKKAIFDSPIPTRRNNDNLVEGLIIGFFFSSIIFFCIPFPSNCVFIYMYSWRTVRPTARAPPRSLGMNGGGCRVTNVSAAAVRRALTSRRRRRRCLPRIKTGSRARRSQGEPVNSPGVEVLDSPPLGSGGGVVPERI